MSIRVRNEFAFTFYKKYVYTFVTFRSMMVYIHDDYDKNNNNIKSNCYTEPRVMNDYFNK